MDEADVVAKLEFLFTDFIKQLSIVPSKIVLRTSYDESAFQLSYSGRHSKKLASDIFCFQQIYKLVLLGKSSTKRDLYYENANLYGSQSTCDRSITSACEILGCQRKELNVVYFRCYEIGSQLLQTSCSKGLLQEYSHFRYTIYEVLAIPELTEDLMDHKVISDAEFILVVEKEATFQKLKDEDMFRFFKRSILITGKGYPDICTRLFVRWLREKLQIPVYGFFDCDPHGIEIFLTYKFGSSKDNSEGKDAYISDIGWIGVYPSDMHLYPIDDNQFIPLKNSDFRKIDQLEKRARTFGEHEVVSELTILRSERHKLELEAISSIGCCFITRVFLQSKLTPLLSAVNNTLEAFSEDSF